MKAPKGCGMSGQLQDFAVLARISREMVGAVVLHAVG